MSAADHKRGWCPSLLRPMESGDGWLVRVRPRAAVIPATVARAVAEAASAFGNGRIEITNRANLQIRGLRLETIPPFVAAMEAVGAADDGPAVLVSPLAGADPGVAADTLDMAAAMARGVSDDRRSSPKFGVLIDGGGVLPLTGLALDVTLRATAGGWRRDDTPMRRGKAPSLGFYRYGERGAVLLAPPFGQLHATQLARLAGLAERWGDGALRPTPWKSLAIAGVAPADEGFLRDQAHRIGIISDPADPRLGIVTCAGAPACLRGEAETRPAAEALARLRRPDDALMHVSGCAKGCAHPGPAPITLVGEGGRFTLVRDGRADGVPMARGLTLAEIARLMQSVPA